MLFVYPLVIAAVCIEMAKTCDNHNTPVVQFCTNDKVENNGTIYIGNTNVPRLSNNNCTCVISPVKLHGQLSVNWVQSSNTGNVSFVHRNGALIVFYTGTTKGVPITDDVQVIYQTSEVDHFTPVCLELKATTGTFSVYCTARRIINETNTTTQSSPSLTNATSTKHYISSNQVNTQRQDNIQNTDDNAVLLGPIIGGICAVLVVTVAVTVVIVVVRRRKLDTSKSTGPNDEDTTTENPIYDTDGPPNHETNVQNRTSMEEAVHYNTVNSSDEAVENDASTHTGKNNMQDYYSKVDKKTKTRVSNDNTSRHKPFIDKPTDHYDRTDTKNEILPFNEYNHLSTVHRYPHDALDNYDKTNIQFSTRNDHHDEDEDTYNTTFSH